MDEDEVREMLAEECGALNASNSSTSLNASPNVNISPSPTRRQPQTQLHQPDLRQSGSSQTPIQPNTGLNHSAGIVRNQSRLQLDINSTRMGIPSKEPPGSPALVRAHTQQFQPQNPAGISVNVVGVGGGVGVAATPSSFGLVGPTIASQEPETILAIAHSVKELKAKKKGDAEAKGMSLMESKGFSLFGAKGDAESKFSLFGGRSRGASNS
ncbi:hypothetical protein M1146_07550, partial [Patescibacteria group bacterium]|nr:hypothetical protein [Patescibacteria group bacterium]